MLLRVSSRAIIVSARGLGNPALPPAGGVFLFARIVEAHRYLESNQQLGKIVVTI